MVRFQPTMYEQAIARAQAAEAEADRLREQLRIAEEVLQRFSDQERERHPGEMGTFAHDALIRMSVVEDDHLRCLVDNSPEAE